MGNRASAAGYRIRDFLSRNGVPYEWVEVDNSERVAALVPEDERDLDRLPVCILPNGVRLAPATLEGVAAGLGMVAAPTLSEYDLTIVGAGPAGLAAAVYAASEGLRAVAVESVAPGGQAGTTSMIENYLGFPQGISGSELATRATAQARRYGSPRAYAAASSGGLRLRRAVHRAAPIGRSHIGRRVQPAIGGGGHQHRHRS